ncbi:MAG: hypothetical protein KGJ01_01110 [Patescibacteria group bacterium]|nr:hypothetical protein [Patescibacteria group bacterium]
MDEEERKKVSIDPELMSLVKDKRRDGWSDNRIKEWLTKEHSLYSGAQIDKVLDVLEEADEPMRKKSAKQKARRERSYKIERVLSLSAIGVLILIFIAISPLPRLIGTYVFGQHPGSCAYLDNQYCSKGVTIKEADGNNYLAFNLPSGSFVFAPFTGVFNYGVPDYTNQGVYTAGDVIIASNNTTTTFKFYSYFEPMVSSSTIVTKGEPIAIIKGPAIDEAHNANFLIKE